jgi:hypothetical protein
MISSLTFGLRTGRSTAIGQLRLDLAAVVSAEALFCLTDRCDLSVEDGTDNAEKTASPITSAVFRSAGATG